MTGEALSSGDNAARLGGTAPTPSHGVVTRSKLQPDLTVFDSATADGYWLQGLAQHVALIAKLLGADIAPQHFVRQSELPANVSLFTHNIFNPLPDFAQNAFDLVHQRFVLPTCSDETSVDIIWKLIGCINLRGYIMLHDANFDTIDEEEGRKATQ
jgi:gliotoxin biosynthesis N-methyltransferase